MDIVEMGEFRKIKESFGKWKSWKWRNSGRSRNHLEYGHRGKDGIETHSEQLLYTVTYGTVDTTLRISSAGPSCGRYLIPVIPVVQKWFLLDIGNQYADPIQLGH